MAASGEGRAVRKTVTVVFSDLVGSTPLGERLDPESLREVITRYYDRAAQVLARHGGTVEKFIGDAVPAVFGIPRLHEDDALRAVCGASELGGALERAVGGRGCHLAVVLGPAGVGKSRLAQSSWRPCRARRRCCAAAAWSTGRA
jgi:class 3 adenylate cyclase